MNLKNHRKFSFFQKISVVTKKNMRITEKCTELPVYLPCGLEMQFFDERVHRLLSFIFKTIFRLLCYQASIQLRRYHTKCPKFDIVVA